MRIQNEVESFILIGGRSSRFGSDKAFAQFGDRGFANVAAETAAEAFTGGKITFVASSDTQFDPGRILSLDHPVVTDLRPGFGAWSGFDTAINYANADHVLILACDLPLVSPDLLRRLSERGSTNSAAVIPRQTDGRLQPLCALYRPPYWRVLLAELDFGNRSLPPLAGFVETQPIEVVEPHEYADLPGAADFFANINTTRELSRICGGSASE